jgi:hypothetical protein
MQTVDQDPLSILRASRRPRHYGWYPFVQRRRQAYSFACLLLLCCFVMVPLADGWSKMSHGASWRYLEPIQVALFFGALTVVAFVRVVMGLYKQFDDSKWLARYGMVAEANLLWVLNDGKSLLVSYRFWDHQDIEHEAEVVITADGPTKLPALKPGSITAVLYDPRQAEKRHALWADVARYVTPLDGSDHPFAPIFRHQAETQDT